MWLLFVCHTVEVGRVSQQKVCQGPVAGQQGYVRGLQPGLHEAGLLVTRGLLESRVEAGCVLAAQLLLQLSCRHACQWHCITARG
jgi:hypothetical protein